MTAITVANTDWSILDGVLSALRGATIEDESVFESVSVTTADAQALQCQFTRHPAAVLRYLTTREFVCPEGLVGCTVEVELLLATRGQTPATDESDALEEILRLLNAAKNALHAAPPVDATEWLDGDQIAPAIEFGRPQIDTAQRQPWSLAKLPARFTFLLEGPALH